MLGNSLRFAAAAIVTASVALADKPLAEVAQSYAEKLPAGCIATGEWNGTAAN